MNIKFIATFRHDGQKYVEGRTEPDFDDKLGAYFCEAGWAEDMDGVVPTRQPKVGETVYLNPDNVRHKLVSRMGRLALDTE